MKGQRIQRGGPIPARAGETRLLHFFRAWRRAYPRTCGGNLYRVLKHHLQEGLSPHVRGKRYLSLLLSLLVGPIPARAGETESRMRERLAAGAYPRTCGGNMSVPSLACK